MANGLDRKFLLFLDQDSVAVGQGRIINLESGGDARPTRPY